MGYNKSVEDNPLPLPIRSHFNLLSYGVNHRPVFTPPPLKKTVAFKDTPKPKATKPTMWDYRSKKVNVHTERSFLFDIAKNSAYNKGER